MNKNLKNHTSGFTLLEMAIVVVIIALMVAAVLEGKELIKQTKLRLVLKKITEMDIAVNAFNDKYGALPGDFQSAHEDGIDTLQGSSIPNLAATIINANGDGNGDGNLNSYWAGSFGVYEGEIANFIVELVNTQLIEGNYSQPSGCINGGGTNCNMDSMAEPPAFPRLPIVGGLIGVTSRAELYYIIGTPSAFINGGGLDQARGATIIPKDANTIDTKIDDGFPNSGNVQAMGSYNYGDTFWPDTPAAGCINGTQPTDTYTDSNKSPACTIYVKAKFTHY